MNSEPQKETQPPSQERSEREATFSRRGLLQWSVPAILAVTLPSQVSAGSIHSDHGDSHRDHGDMHTDFHDDMHSDSHTDLHKDSHDDHPNPFGGKGSGQVPNFSSTTPAGRSGSGVVPNYSAPGSSIGGAPSQGGSGIVPRFNPPKK